MPAVIAGIGTADEGSGCTVRMHISEESDSGTVPMNQSNIDERLLAEIEEGRPPIEENTHQPKEPPIKPILRRGTTSVVPISAAKSTRASAPEGMRIGAIETCSGLT